MQSITFNGHPGDIIEAVTNHGGLKTYIQIGTNKLKIEAIKFLGNNQYKIFCEFPNNKVQKENIIIKLNEMLAVNEITGYCDLSPNP